ncbi:MAG: hypothetical protein FWD32_02640 [Firmicutes bacterium]|nr:hypothetical protein [Bacillota bacterium]
MEEEKQVSGQKSTLKIFCFLFVNALAVIALLSITLDYVNPQNDNWSAVRYLTGNSRYDIYTPWILLFICVLLIISYLVTVLNKKKLFIWLNISVLCLSLPCSYFAAKGMIPMPQTVYSHISVYIAEEKSQVFDSKAFKTSDFKHGNIKNIQGYYSYVSYNGETIRFVRLRLNCTGKLFADSAIKDLRKLDFVTSVTYSSSGLW